MACLNIAFGTLSEHALLDVAGLDCRMRAFSLSYAAAFAARMENAPYDAPEDRTLAAMYF